MKNIFIYVLFIFSFSIMSCGDWLDVRPSDQMSEEEQYGKAEGFYNQLNGIYRTMAGAELYGKELSWGLIDVVAQYYNMGNYSDCRNYGYRNAAHFNYEYDRTRSFFNNFWEKMYNAIANCNNLILNTMSADTTLFPLRKMERDCIEGEALALRAMLHFDLLRMFAPAPRVDSLGTYIPYVEHFPTHVTVDLPTREILEKVNEDLLKAHELTMRYDTLYKGNIHDKSRRLEFVGSNKKRFMSHRGYRLNHYAIKALLARVAHWRGNRSDALKWSTEVMGYVGKGWFRFTTEYYIKNQKNIKLYDDVLFALYNNKATDYESNENTGDAKMTLWDYSTLFGDDKNRDIRRWQWQEDINGDYCALKYKKLDDNTRYAKTCNTMIPMLRVSEMCYIIAESSYMTKKDYAEQYLSYIRKMRGCVTELPHTDSQEEFNRLILNDFRREFYGEGQLFFFYKRLGLDAIGDSRTMVKFGEGFVFPIPESNDI